jgi:hypothetical protein
MPDLFLLTTKIAICRPVSKDYIVHIADRFIRTVGTEQFILSQNVTKNMLLVEKITWPQRLNVIVTIIFD